MKPFYISYNGRLVQNFEGHTVVNANDAEEAKASFMSQVGDKMSDVEFVQVVQIEEGSVVETFLNITRSLQSMGYPLDAFMQQMLEKSGISESPDSEAKVIN